MNYYLAIDIGASGGRHILGHMENGLLVTEEIYRFDNGAIKKDGELLWDTQHIFTEILNGLKACAAANKVPVSMGIDTWGVDYVLTDANGEKIGRSYCYRDARTACIDQEVYRQISEEDLYLRTGIQKQIFNTIYQLAALQRQSLSDLEQAKHFLMIPDYFHYLLTGEYSNEYTNASTTQLVSPLTKNWDYDLIKKLGFPPHIFHDLKMPGSFLGKFTDAISKEVGFCCNVVIPATHDTGSAVMAVPCADENSAYISSGTWSLMGIETNVPIISQDSLHANFTNEGGYDYRFRFLKNIMGLWMIQSVRHETGDRYSWEDLTEMARASITFPSRVEVDHSCFLAPENMTEEIRSYCRGTFQPVPKSVGETASVVYQSLAGDYVRTADEMERLTGKKISTICIVGGGSKSPFLNRLTAIKSGRRVLAGPGEATAIGNLTAQLLSAGIFTDLMSARKCIYESFGVMNYEPDENL
ncbi:MAG: rhamnulokinase [Butyrivibrio sp.]|nr:rhamnulokinase [Butyrivibrio sp.]